MHQAVLARKNAGGATPGILWGDDTVDAVVDALGNNRTVKVQRTAGASGTLTNGYAYIGQSDSSEDPCKLIVFDTSGNVLAESDVATLPGNSVNWVEFTFSGGAQIAITGSTSYVVSPHCGDTVECQGNGGNKDYNNDTYSDGVEDPTTWGSWQEEDINMYLWGTLS